MPRHPPHGGAFRRDLHDLIRNITSLETVPWASVPRYVVRPQNYGDATTHGIEFDAKFQLEELVHGASALAVKSNVSVYGRRAAAGERTSAPTIPSASCR